MTRQRPPCLWTRSLDSNTIDLPRIPFPLLTFFPRPGALADAFGLSYFTENQAVRPRPKLTGAHDNSSHLSVPRLDTIDSVVHTIVFPPLSCTPSSTSPTLEVMRTSLLHRHYLLLLLMRMLLRKSPMRLGLDQLQEHVQSYWNNR
jgi:hypothetical protein